MIVVTGGAGFIGSNLLKALNENGEDDIIVVDNLAKADKFRNIADCRFAEYIDKNEFPATLAKLDKVRAIFHQGACSDTMETDGRYMMENNYAYSVALLRYCLGKQVPFIYASSASVYGNGPEFVEEPRCEAALNIYAYSKLLFDQFVRRHCAAVSSQVVGLRYFNVYGPNEGHKDRMASVAYHFAEQYRRDGTVRLFEGSGGYESGEQRRDFVWVGDTVAVNLYFLENPGVSGIFNVGSGTSRSFNDMAASVVNACDGGDRSVDELVRDGVVRYIPFPESLIGKYQSYTEADLGALRAAGFSKPFTTVESGTRQYIAQ